MSEVYLTKMQGGNLIPASQQDYEKIKGYKLGSTIRAEISRPRNGQHHRKACALINLIMENQDTYNTFEDLLVEIKLKAGHYQEHITTKGNLIYVPKSISFAAMSQDDFSVFYDKMIDIALQNWLDNKSEAEVRQYVEQVMGYTG